MNRQVFGAIQSQSYDKSTELCMGNCTFGITRRALLRRAKQHAKQLKKKRRRRKKVVFKSDWIDVRPHVRAHRAQVDASASVSNACKVLFRFYFRRNMCKKHLWQPRTHMNVNVRQYMVWITLHTHGIHRWHLVPVSISFFCIFKKSYVHAECNKCSNVAHLVYTQTWIMIV